MLTAFTSGLLLISISEIGDKSFFVAALLAMRYCRRSVFLGAIAALAIMTVISVGLAQVFNFVPKFWVHYGAIALFLIFGVGQLWEARSMPKRKGCEGATEAIAYLRENFKESKFTSHKYANQFPSWQVFSQSFSLTFLAEWGDRTQFNTIALGASHNLVGVAMGAILGHGICSLIAIICGSFLAERISDRWVTLIGGLLFILFGLVYFAQGE
jgi:Ca2+/H+ antiporter, TMEM165/GDT1 family